MKLGSLLGLEESPKSVTLPDIHISPKDHNTVMHYKSVVRQIDRLKWARQATMKGALLHPEIKSIELVLERQANEIQKLKNERDDILMQLGTRKLNELVERLQMQRNLRLENKILSRFVDKLL